jgi:hypothetical protein
MGRDEELEKKFAANLDRILAGEQVEADAGADEDYRTAVDFARQMVDMRAAPSDAFKARLKEKLIGELAAKQAQRTAGEGRNRFREFLGGLIPRQTAWQALATAVVVIIIIVGVTWGIGLWRQPAATPLVTVPAPAPAPVAPAAPAPTTPVTPATPTAPAAPAKPAAPAAPAPLPGTQAVLAADARTDQASYLPGERVAISVTLINVTSQPFPVEHFPPTVSIMDSNTQQGVYTFPAGTQSVSLPPGSPVTFNLVWNERNDRGQPAPPGSYYLELENIEYGGQSYRVNLSRPVQWIILPAGSQTTTEERTITVNQSQIAQGITVTLERVVISPLQFTIDAYATAPADYSYNASLEKPAASYTATAQYYIDGNWVKDAGQSSVEYFPDGMRHSWVVMEAVPQDAQELLFTITAIGGWQGNWEFRVPLR